MKKFLKVMATLMMVIGITTMSVSCTGKAKANENFDYIMDYFQDNIVEKEQEMIHCDITKTKDGYLLTYSYEVKDATYVVVITFDDECEITRYDAYGDGMYVNNVTE